MAKVKRYFYLDDRRDADLLTWLQRQPNRSWVARQALRAWMSQEKGLNENALRRVLREELAQVTIQGAAPVAPEADQEDEDVTEALPLYPPLVVGGAAILIIGLTLWLFGRSRGTVLFAVSIIFLAAGLVVGLVGVSCAHDPDKPVDAIRWGAFEDLAEEVVGPDVFRRWEQITVAGVGLGLLLLGLIYKDIGASDPAERQRRRLAQDKRQGQALGSAELCNRRAFRRWSKPDSWGWTLQGQFWGAQGRRLGRRLCLSGEDIARGVAVFGPQGTGKTQGVILPAIAALTGHLLVVHNPSDPAGSCAFNLCDWIDNVADAQAMAAVLLSGAQQPGENSFWQRATTNLLAACVLHYPSLGAVMDAGCETRGPAGRLEQRRRRAGGVPAASGGGGPDRELGVFRVFSFQAKSHPGDPLFWRFGQ